jgi:hypothetical protein
MRVKKLREQEETVKEDITELKDTKYSILKSDLDSINFEKQYNKLKGMLELSVNRANYDKLLELVDSVTEYTRVAGNMFAGAKEEYESFKSGEYAIWWARESNNASRILEELKRNKKISGQISEEKVRNWIIENRSDKYAMYTRKMNRLKLAVDMMKILYEQFESRKSLLQTQSNLIERRKPVMIVDKK